MQHLRCALLILLAAGAVAAQGGQEAALLGGLLDGTVPVGPGIGALSGPGSFTARLSSPDASLVGQDFLILAEVTTPGPLVMVNLPNALGALGITPQNAFVLAGSLVPGKLPLPVGGHELGLILTEPELPQRLLLQAVLTDPTAPSGLGITGVAGVDSGTATNLTTVTESGSRGLGYGLAAHDLDGDGNADLIGGAYTSDIPGTPKAGRTFLYGGLPPSLNQVIDDPLPETNALFGLSVSGGDINGDGFEDLVVGARAATVGTLANAGEAFVFWGPSLTATTTLTDLAPETGAQFGHWTTCGDFDGDGFCDVVVSAPWAQVGGMPKMGTLTVFFGPTLGPAITLPNPLPLSEDRFGYRVEAEDLDLDGFCDLCVAHTFRPSENTLIPKVGAVSVFFGPFFSNLVLVTHPMPNSNALMGADLAIADLNDDGFPDFIAGAEFDSSGGFLEQGSLVVADGPSFTTTTLIYSPSPDVNAGFGGGLDVGDFNGDDEPDIFVSEFYYDAGGILNSGRCQVLLGPAFAGGYTFEEPMQSVDSQFGRRVRAGDLDGDGRDEILIGAPLSDAGGSQNSGAIYVGSLQ